MPHSLVIGCGNLLRGDDAAGPVLVRRLRERGLPEGVECADAGTDGMEVVFRMRGMPEVVCIDACTSGSEPGSLFELSAAECASLPLPAGVGTHAFRWDQALALGRLLLKDEYPPCVRAYLIEGESFAVGAGLSPAVDRAIDRLADRILKSSRFPAQS
jgi:hydrogenase maturation protease